MGAYMVPCNRHRGANNWEGNPTGPGFGGAMGWDFDFGLTLA